MKKEDKRLIVMPILQFLLFVFFTLLVRTINVMPVGPEGSSVGFASVNSVFAGVFSFNPVFYEISELLGYMAIGVCLGFALFGAYMLIKGKSIKAVDKEIWILAGFYVVVMAFYALFEKVVINYRPVILEEGLEASYPSSHTMLAVCVFVSAVYEFEIYMASKPILKNVCTAIAIAAAAITVITRTFSGVHWISDIIGGLLLSFALLSAFVSVLTLCREKNK